MENTKNKNELSKKPTWYLFALCNIIVLIGCVATYAMAIKTDTDLGKLFIPTLVCNLIAVALAILFVYLEQRLIMPKQMHFQRKWLKFYLAAIIIFVCAIVFNSIFFVACINKTSSFDKKSWQLIVHLVVTGVLTLVAIGFQRYARFKIDLDIYRRNHGEEIKQDDKPKKEPKKEIATKPDSDNKATGGLLDQM